MLYSEKSFFFGGGGGGEGGGFEDTDILEEMQNVFGTILILVGRSPIGLMYSWWYCNKN